MEKAYIIDVSVWYPFWRYDPKLRLDLSDGRTIVVPMNWYPKLEKTTFEQRSNWRLIGKGEGIRWPDIGEDISLRSILDGKPSAEYRTAEYRKKFQKLIERYAKGKTICNCREAYYENCGEGHVDGEYRTDIPICKHGCSANQIAAKEYVAAMALHELEQKGKV